MPGDEDNAVAYEFLGDGHRLVRIARVVGERQFNSLSKDTAVGVDIGDRHLGALLDLLTAEDVLSGKRTCGRYQNLGPGVGRANQRHSDGGE
jgi:hypothetical protein